MYSLFIKDVANSRTYELPFGSASYTYELNKGGNATFSFDYLAILEILAVSGTDPLFVFSAGKREIWLEKNGTKIYFGLVSDYGFKKGKDGGLSLQVASVDLVTFLSKRRTGALRFFDGVDAGLIAWTLIDESQNSDNPYSDLGITEGSITASINRQRTFNFAELRAEIAQMSNDNMENGFDFDINTSKQFNVFYPAKGTTRSGLVMDDKNILTWDFHKPLIMSLTNKVYALGAGVNTDRAYATRTADVSYRTVYGLIEDIVSDPNMGEAANLNDLGDKFLYWNQAPFVTITITHLDDDPDITTYDIGDTLPLTIPELGYDLELKRVYKRTVDIDGNESATVTLEMK